METLTDTWADHGDEKLDEDAIRAIRRVETALENQGTDEATALARRFDDAAERELMSTPHQRAINILAGRRPRLLFFDEDARSLPTEFDLVELDSAPRGLRNLARLGGLD